MNAPEHSKEPADDLPAAGWACLRLLLRVRAWAFFTVRRRVARLRGSDRIDQGCLDHAAQFADLGRSLVLAGRRDEWRGGMARSRLLFAFPRLVSMREHGLLYLEDLPPDARVNALFDLDALTLDAVLRTYGRTKHSLLPDLSDADAARRAELLMLLEQEEWMVSRVARRLGVTRMTVYNRMERYSIPSKRELKPPAKPPSSGETAQ